MKIDNALPLMRLVLMRRACSLIALLLVTLWLPATQHCELVAAGLLQSTVAQDGTKCDCPPGSPCSKDNCQNLDLNLSSPVSENFIIVVPQATLCSCPICERCLDLNPIAESAASPKFFVEPSAQARPWQFQRRAAPAPRSPTSA